MTEPAERRGFVAVLQHTALVEGHQERAAVAALVPWPIARIEWVYVDGKPITIAHRAPEPDYINPARVTPTCSPYWITGVQPDDEGPLP